MKGYKIADLLIEWANLERIHPDDFDNLFVSELIELLYEDEKE